MAQYDTVASVGTESQARTERSLLLALMAARAVNLSQAVLTVITGWRSYRRPRIAAVSLAAALIESGLVARRSWDRRALTEGPAWVEACFGAAGLLALAAAATKEDRTSSMNWMSPYTAVSTASFALGMERPRRAIAATALVTATYAATVLPAVRVNRQLTATAVGNTAVYPGLFATAQVLTRLLRAAADDVERARAEAVERGQQLATETERNRQHRLLHDSALQTLEAIATGHEFEPDQLRSQARREATVLRGALSGRPIETAGLVSRLEQVAEELSGRGIRVELMTGEVENEPCVAAADALCEATREALTNAAKHAGVTRVVVRASSEENSIRVTVRDQGRGFDLTRMAGGFGIENCIKARLAEVGGHASLWSRPDRGTKVELWAPS